MNCESEEEVRERITEDMKQFNKDALENYKEYDTIFQDNLLTPYRNNLIELQKLYEQTAQLVNSINGLWVNDNNNLTYDQLLADSASNNELDTSVDYSALMLAAKDEETFWKLAALRDEKAKAKGIDISGNNSKYRSNQSFYEQWASNSHDSQEYSANLNNLNWTKDYSAAMLNASSEEEFWALAAQRDAKAALRGLDTTGADSRYRSNDEFYELWAANHKDLATYSHKNKETLDADNNYWKAYAQTDSTLKNNIVGTTDDYVNDLCKEWVEYNNQYNTLLNQGMSKNNSKLQTLAEKMSDIQDQIADRMKLSVSEIKTIGSAMIDAQEEVTAGLTNAINNAQQSVSKSREDLDKDIKDAYEQAAATGENVQFGDKWEIQASKIKSSSSGSSWTDDEMSEGFNAATTTTKSSSSKNSMVRDTSKAGTTVSSGGYKITYNSLGYATSKVKEKSYSTGIENGPVTYTGLAMLHGTPTSPEFVLNSDQAYNLLRNMATTKMPEMQKVSGGETQSTQYIVQGDIVLENTNDPAQFWDDVSKAMSNRHNVTKNR